MELLKKAYGRYRSLLGAFIAIVVVSAALGIFRQGYLAASIFLLSLFFAAGIIVYRIVGFMGFKKSIPNYGDALKEIKAEYKNFYTENLQAMKEKRPYVSPYKTKVGVIAFIVVAVLGYFGGQNPPKGVVVANSAPVQTVPTASLPSVDFSQVADVLSANLQTHWKFKLKKEQDGYNSGAQGGYVMSADETKRLGGLTRVVILQRAATGVNIEFLTRAPIKEVDKNLDLFLQDFGITQQILLNMFPEDAADINALYAESLKSLQGLLEGTRTPKNVGQYSLQFYFKDDHIYYNARAMKKLPNLK